MKKNRFFFFGVIAIFPIVVSCSSKQINRKDLKLEYFGLNTAEPVKRIKNYNENTEIKSEVSLNNDYDKQTLTVIVKNDNRFSFVDLVILNHSDNTQYVFNEGNGEYTCLSNTVNSGNQWETKIEINVNNYFINLDHENGAQTSLEIKEINFYNFSSKIEKANLNSIDVCTLTFGWSGVAFYGESPNRVVTNENLIKKLNSVNVERNTVFTFENKQYIKVLGDKHGWYIARFANFKDLIPGNDYYYRIEKITWEIVSETNNDITMLQQYAIPNVDDYVMPLSSLGYSLLVNSADKLVASDYVVALGTPSVSYAMSDEPTIGFCYNTGKEELRRYTMVITK